MRIGAIGGDGSREGTVSLDRRQGGFELLQERGRVSKMAVMNFRSEADIAALKAQAAR